MSQSNMPNGSKFAANSNLDVNLTLKLNPV